MLRGCCIIVLLLAAILCAAQVTRAAARPAFQPTVGSEKESRTPAQRKIASPLLHEISRLKGHAGGTPGPSAGTGVKTDRHNRALVDVRADVTPELQKKIRSLKGTIVSTSPEYRTIVAWMPLLRLERLAEDRRVSAISPLADPVMHRR